LTTLPPQHFRAVCPKCTNPTGVTLCSVTIYGGTATLYLGCSCCDHAWSDVVVDDDDSSLDTKGITAWSEPRVVIH